MGVVDREAVAAASPSTIWSACFADPTTWPEWDADVERVDVEDAATGLKENAKVAFIMKDGGMKVPTVCTDVKENERFTFSGSFAMGLMQYCGKIVLTPEEGSTAESPKTHVSYKFEMKGLIGTIFTALNSKAVIGGTEKGLENIVKLSEDAQKK